MSSEIYTPQLNHFLCTLRSINSLPSNPHYGASQYVHYSHSYDISVISRCCLSFCCRPASHSQQQRTMIWCTRHGKRAVLVHHLFQCIMGYIITVGQKDSHLAFRQPHKRANSLTTPLLRKKRLILSTAAFPILGKAYGREKLKIKFAIV